MLRLHIAVEAPWTEIGPIACQLLDRTFAGKAVLHLG
jgi:NADPH2:quinone reductase